MMGALKVSITPCLRIDRLQHAPARRHRLLKQTHKRARAISNAKRMRKLLKMRCEKML
jgi:hypothetical protein